jgi:hypothetical protein
MSFAVGNHHYKNKYTNWSTVLEIRDSVGGIATGYGLDYRGAGVRVPGSSRIFFPPRRPDRLWDPPCLLSNGYQWLFSRG